MFIPRYYESLGHLHVGTQPNRAYYVPASTPMDTVGENRVNSDRFMLLNGDWDFKYYASIYDLDAEVSRLRAAGRPVFYDVDFGGDDAPENADPRTAATGALAAGRLHDDAGAERVAEPWFRPPPVHEFRLSVPVRPAVRAAGQPVRRVPVRFHAYVRS